MVDVKALIGVSFERVRLQAVVMTCQCNQKAYQSLGSNPIWIQVEMYGTVACSVHLMIMARDSTRF
jgi:hypothetical protein